MKLKAAINGSVYDIVEGATFAEEYSETLDSGAIIIDKVQKFDLRPYDDVFIFDADEDEYRGWGNHVSQSYMVDLEENIHYVLKPQMSIIGVTTTVPPTPIWAANTAINISKREMDPLISRIASGGGWYARIRCDSYYEQPQSGTEYFKDNIGFVALYRITAQIGFPDSYLIFDKIPSANEYGNPPLKMTYKAGALDQYYTMSSDLPDSPRIYFINPRFSSYIEIEPTQGPIYKGFHKHMLVDQYEATCINITSRTYKYKIGLFSETKKLEKIILPNIALTQPIPIANRKSVWEYLNRFVEIYSPRVKIGIPASEGNVGTWSNVRKYSIDANLQSAFENVYAPEMQMNQPTLRDVLTQLMLAKDMIPYVEDDVIKGMDLSRTSGDFAYSDDETTQIVTSMSSSNYATGLKRQFDNALAQDKTCTRVEYLGFRNSDQGLLTLENIRLEFSYPIYKISKMLLCYWKKLSLLDENNDPAGEDRWFLCKQDITPLIMPNQKRNILSQNWTSFPTTPMTLTTVEEMADYRLYTIGYDIGSREITGWGEIYSYPDTSNGWWASTTRSYIENIIELLDRINPYGIYENGWELVSEQIPEGLHGMPVAYKHLLPETFPTSPYAQNFSGSSLWIKGLLFQVEYQAFYNGATYADKEDDRDDIVSPDNPSSSLTILEKDGIFQEAKANRFGNEATQINCRYADPSGMQPLASVFDDDKIVFRREYSIFSNITQVAYSATKGYILKNYFTSVFAQLRPFPLAGYDQSVNRADVDRMYVQLSKDTLISDPNNKLEIIDGAILSSFEPTLTPESIGDTKNPMKITLQTISKSGDNYASDTQTFANGHSLCISFQMRDNLGMGNYIKNALPFNANIYSNAIGWGTEEWKTGSEQDWYSVIDDQETGEINQEIEFAGFNSTDDNPQVVANSNDVNSIYDDYFALPKRPAGSNKIISIKKNPMKDGKEVLSQTIQFEYQAGEGIAISGMLPRLNDMVGAFDKWPQDVTISNIENKAGKIRWFGVTEFGINPRPLGSPTSLMMPEFVIGIADTEDLTTLAGRRIYLDATGKDVSAIWKTKVSDALYWSGSLASGGAPSEYESPSIKSIEISEIEIVGATSSELRLRWQERQKIITHHFSWTTTSEDIFTRTVALQRRTIGEPAGWLYFTTGIPYTTTSEIFGGLWGANTILDNPPTGISENNVLPYPSGEGFMYTTSALTETMPQNQFVVYSMEKVKKERAYDEYASISASNEAFTDVFSVGDKQITINLANAPEGTKSVQYWYLDQDSGAYRFVFGVDVTQAELDRGYAIVWASVTQTKDRRVYDFAMNQIGECANAARDIELSDGRYYN